MNRRPPACKADALPAELQPPFFCLVFFVWAVPAPYSRLGHACLDTLPSPLAALPCHNKKPQAKTCGYLPFRPGTRTHALTKNPDTKSPVCGTPSTHRAFTAIFKEHHAPSIRASRQPQPPQATAQAACHAGSLQVNSESGVLCKGGDPAAGSPTATLLRLHPNHRPYRRRLPHCCWLTGFG